jgi:hypothetical protein
VKRHQKKDFRRGRPDANKPNLIMVLVYSEAIQWFGNDRTSIVSGP